MLLRRGICTSSLRRRYDVLVVGGGHAGCEAASAAARMGANTLMVTHKFDTIGEMSCNPSFGGIGKGHLLREIDALDGLAPKICDKSGISYKVLNKSKGPAVWGPRAQIDRKIYKSNMQRTIEGHGNLKVVEASVEDLCVEEGAGGGIKCRGILLESGEKVESRCVILTTGTFLKAMINLGLETWPAGRMGDRPAIGLANTLERLGFEIGRLKTGTPPRLEKGSIDFTNLNTIGNDNPPIPFSFMNDRVSIEPEEQIETYVTRTNEAVEKIVKANMHRNLHVREEVNGPRYCPSIESKVMRFGGREHHVWLEAEGFDSDVIYPNGISCTMPQEEQEKLVRCLPGCEKAILIRPGYGVEYDYVDPRELYPWLETKKISGLFFAGQINGTTGYEEAASQGLVAGLNAARAVQDKQPESLSRLESYIGVLIDDLTTQGTMEPYRMFTSRSEFRLYLRPDNADLRLTGKGYEAGCVSRERHERMIKVKEDLARARDVLKAKEMSSEAWAHIMPSSGLSQSPAKRSAHGLLATPTLNLQELLDSFDHHPDLGVVFADHILLQRLRTEAVYEPLVAIQLKEIKDLSRHEQLELSVDFDYSHPSLNLSNEIRNKLAVARPATIGAASRIQGMTPDALLRLINFSRRDSLAKSAHSRS